MVKMPHTENGGRYIVTLNDLTLRKTYALVRTQY
jgi:hypothetical protein